MNFELTDISSPLSRGDSAQKWPQEHENADICALRFSRDQKQVAIGCFNGDVYVRAVSTSRIMYRIRATPIESPISSLVWHPTSKNTVICSSSDGHIYGYHIESGQLLWDIAEEGNHINSLNISPKGSELVTVGTDCSVRVYNTFTKQNIATLNSKNFIQGQVTGHQNRVFATAFIDDNTIASSGWDDSILIWDIRQSKIVRMISGPHICGEALEVIDDKLVAGSFKNQNQLQLFDVGSGKCIKSVSIGTTAEPLQINVLKFNPLSRIIAAGGAGLNCGAFFRDDLSQIGRTVRFESPVTALDLTDSRVAFGLANSVVYVQNYNLGI